MSVNANQIDSGRAEANSQTKPKMPIKEFCINLNKVQEEVERIKKNHIRENGKFIENSGLQLKKVWLHDAYKLRALEMMFKNRKSAFKSDLHDEEVAREKIEMLSERKFKKEIETQHAENKKYGREQEYGIKQIEEKY